MSKIRNFLCFFICSFHLNCPTTEEQITDRQVLLGEPKRFRVTRNILLTFLFGAKLNYESCMAKPKLTQNGEI